jgi:hypothetical protein
MWVRAVLLELAAGRRALPPQGLSERLGESLEPEGLYSPVYLARRAFVQAVGELPHRRIIIVRDPRDTLVSWYFSIRYTHPENAYIGELRGELASLSEQQGLELLIREHLAPIVFFQRSWSIFGEAIIRFEELLHDEQGAFARICRHLGLEVGEAERRRIVSAHSFERRTGRRPGEEDRSSHRRKGVPGDWRNHLTGELKELFKARYGQHLIEMGYEATLDW